MPDKSSAGYTSYVRTTPEEAAATCRANHSVIGGNNINMD